MLDAPWAANMSSEGVRSAEAFSTDSGIVSFLSLCLCWAADMSSEGVRSAVAFSTDSGIVSFLCLCLCWAANMSSEGVRPGEALSTDSAIVGLAVLTKQHWYGSFNVQVSLSVGYSMYSHNICQHLLLDL